jgi:hypothetical protein
LAEQSLTTVIVSPPSSEGHIPPAEDVSTIIGESPKQSITVPSPVNPANLSQKTREEKGKNIARDDMLNDPVIERPEANLLSNPMVNRAEDGARGNFPREGTESEQPGRIAEACSDEMPEGVRAKFLSFMFKTKMFTQKGQTTASNLSDIKLPERPTTSEEQEPGTITVEDQGNALTVSSSGAPSFHVPADAETSLVMDAPASFAPLGLNPKKFSVTSVMEGTWSIHH